MSITAFVLWIVIATVATFLGITVLTVARSTTDWFVVHTQPITVISLKTVENTARYGHIDQRPLAHRTAPNGCSIYGRKRVSFRIDRPLTALC